MFRRLIACWLATSIDRRLLKELVFHAAQSTKSDVCKSTVRHLKLTQPLSVDHDDGDMVDARAAAATAVVVLVNGSNALWFKMKIYRFGILQRQNWMVAYEFPMAGCLGESIRKSNSCLWHFSYNWCCALSMIEMLFVRSLPPLASCICRAAKHLSDIQYFTYDDLLLEWDKSWITMIYAISVKTHKTCR